MLYTVREVRCDDPEDASQLADLWNASDVNWPGGGLNHGVPMTAERMREQLRRQDRILVLGAQANGHLVGYLDVSRVPSREDVAHLVLITVHPEWLSKGCGKALLLDLLDRLGDMGCRELTAKTWSGNQRAIPLYKKVGFFWEPGTSVRLHNFIPAALALPIAGGFFERHDWYQSFRRELAVAPDEIRWHGVRVYPYRFAAGDDQLTMVIDRQAEAPTAVETNDVSVACFLGREEVVCGLPYTLTWEVVARSRDPIRVDLVAEGPAGSELSLAESFEVKDSLRLERPFTVSPDIERLNPGPHGYAIRSRFIIDGLPVVLSTGFRTAQPIDIDVQSRALMPGRPEEVVVRLRNRLGEAVTGEVGFEPRPGLIFDPSTAPFTLPAGAWGSCRFRLTLEEGAHATFVRAICPPGRNAGLGLAAPLRTRAKPVTFRSVPLDRVYAWEDEENEAVVIETPTFWVEAGLRGGGFSVFERLSRQRVLHQDLVALGPPFSRQPDVPCCEHRIETADGRVRLTLEIPANAPPGVIVERALTVGAGPFLRLDHRVRNTTGAAVRAKLRCHGEIHLHRAVTVPLAGGLVHEIVEGLGDFPLRGGGDLPRDPAGYSEGWAAWEEHGLVAGMVWKSCGEIDGGSVQLDLPVIAPGSSVEADPLYFVVARGDWEVVRGLWRQLWQPGGTFEERPPAVHPVLSAVLEPSPLLVTAELTVASLTVRNRRLKPFSGRWTLSAEGFRAEPAAGELRDATPGNPQSRELAFSCADLTPRVTPATIVLSSEATVDERDASIVVVGDAGQEVVVEPIDEGRRYGVGNGWLRFVVAPGHHGSLVSLRREGGRELLASSFPEPRPYQWMAEWFGGVEPFIQEPGDVRHARDSFTGGPVERRGARGLAWRGVGVTCGVRMPAMRWLALTVEYLTTGASNLVALVQRLTNRSGAPQQAPVGFIVFPVVTSGTRVRYDVRRPEGDVRQRERSPLPASFRFGDARWVAMDTEGSLLTLISFLPPGEAGGWLLDRESAGLHTSSPVWLEPGETRERLAWLALTENPRQARGYQALGTLGELP